MFVSITDYLYEFKANWAVGLQDKKFFYTLAGIFAALIPLGLYLVPYLQFIEHRQGVILNDFLLDQFPRADYSNLIFSIIYTSACFMILYSLRSPWMLLRNLLIFIVLQYIRNLCLYFVPLAPPEGIVPLSDPVLEMVAYNRQPLLQDLFFSGHTATCVVFALLTRNHTGLFSTFIVITVVMICLLMIQHCHYTIDILGGIVFAVLAYRLVDRSWLTMKLPFR
ncbi:MAG TPA: phosphatase PAP2-related protein [Saprospiraceae bacterium]|nr:phosphatase PAP2-related protein [Saprospiraceae bacterium]HNT21710.1 phosphatase PAP2-related protein [Saprospiraceae bacterium]